MHALFSMELNDEISISTNFSQDVYHVTRVPGGWLYKDNKAPYHPTTFVPFNKEFQEKDRPKPTTSSFKY